MIKVIGNDPTVTKQVTCKHCGSILEYVPNDIKAKCVKDYTGGSEMYYHIQCPVCFVNVQI